MIDLLAGLTVLGLCLLLVLCLPASAAPTVPASDAQVLERVPQGVELLGVDRAGRLGDVLVLRGERQEDPPQLLPAQLVDAGVAGETEQPRLELRRGLQAADRADHLDEDLLAEILHLVATVGDGEDEAGHPILIRDDEVMQSLLVAALRAALNCAFRARDPLTRAPMIPAPNWPACLLNGCRKPRWFFRGHAAARVLPVV